MSRVFPSPSGARLYAIAPNTDNPPVVSNLPNPQIVLVFDNTPEVSADFLPWHLYDCLTTLLTTSWAQGLREYGYDSGQYAGFAILDFPRGSVSTDDLAQWLKGVVDAGTLPNAGPQTVYVLVPGTTTLVGQQGFAYGHEFCAYHSDIDGVYYAVLPYPNCPNCGPNLGLSAIDSLCMVMAHELAETASDPIVGQGTTFSEGGNTEEIGDAAACLWRPVPITSANGYTYRVQAYLDLRTGRCWTPAPNLVVAPDVPERPAGR